MKTVDSKSKNIKKTLKAVLVRGLTDTAGVEETVKDVLAQVRSRGDAAIKKYTEEFDGVKLAKNVVSQAEINRALKAVSKKDLSIIKTAAKRIENFHRRQIETSSANLDEYGNVLGQKITPLERVGIYVPGGKAVYPSTVLMSAIPAKVAGVDNVIMVTPPGKGGEINKYVLAAADVAGVDKIIKVGGAQAIGALAFGTRTIPKVDKIVGPGNIFVATAKRLVFGIVDIDMVAGPSEILVIDDGSSAPKDIRSIAADLLSQAEHDELASAVLITTKRATARLVTKEVRRQLKKLKRRKIAEESINNYGLIIVAKNLNEAAKISNQIAPEHLELFVDEPEKLLAKIRNAGAIFMGKLTPEAMGDYLAGPNHTLPTGGTARFSSPLGVYDFLKRTSIIGMSKEGLKALGPMTERFSRLEGLEAHAKSVKVRL